MEYKNYTVEDFVLNSRFRKWLLDPQKEDNLFWEDYIKKHPEQLHLIEQAKKIIVSLPKQQYFLDVAEKETLWQDIRQIMNQEGKEDASSEGEVIPMNSEVIIRRANYSTLYNENKKKNRYLRKFFVAASVLIFLASSYFFSRFLSESENAEEIVLNEKVSKQNPWGQKSTVFMIDGTEVILNSGSSITYFKEFESKQRQVYLEGEAFFKVSEDTLKPFRVIANGIVTQALGTSFNVNSYSKDSTSISLVTGKVRVTRLDQDSIPMRDMILEPGEQLNCISSGNQFIKKNFDIKEICAWKDGVIFFQDADSKEVFTYLEKWYGVKIIETNEPLEKWNYTGEFDNLDLYNVLNSIGFAMNFEFTKDEKTYKIRYQK